MEKILFILISFFIAFSVSAGNAVLFTSLHVKESQLKRIERNFRRTYQEKGLKLVVHHKAKPETLHSVMTDNETEVVIWVSHAGGVHSGRNGMEAKGVILDYYGNNVKNFFTLIPPGLKFLGIVGCSAKSIIEGFEERGNYRNYPNLEIKSFDKNVKLFSGLKETLKASLSHIDKETFESPEEERFVNVSVDRFGDYAKSWLEMGDQVIAFMDQTSSRVEAKIPYSIWKQLKNKNIKLVRDASEESLLDFLNIETDDFQRWKRFSLPDGMPIGNKDQHLYLFK